MTTNSQVSTTKPQTKQNKTKTEQKQKQTKQRTRTGTKSQKWRSHGGLSGGKCGKGTGNK